MSLSEEQHRIRSKHLAYTLRSIYVHWAVLNVIYNVLLIGGHLVFYKSLADLHFVPVPSLVVAFVIVANIMFCIGPWLECATLLFFGIRMDGDSYAWFCFGVLITLVFGAWGMLWTGVFLLQPFYE